MASAGDLDILQRARIETRDCVTLASDFHAPLAISGEAAPSVIRMRRQRIDATALALILQTIWPSVEAALKVGAMVTVTNKSVRVRRLPIARI
jgi:predicted nuclease of predicted toxin-antitoxin system